MLSLPTNRFLASYSPAHAKAIWVTSAVRFGRTALFAAVGAGLALWFSGRIRARTLNGELLWSRVVIAGALGGALEAVLGILWVKKMVLLYETSPTSALSVSTLVTVAVSMIVILLLVVRVTKRR